MVPPHGLCVCCVTEVQRKCKFDNAKFALEAARWGIFPALCSDLRTTVCAKSNSSALSFLMKPQINAVSFASGSQAQSSKPPKLSCLPNAVRNAVARDRPQMCNRTLVVCSY
jgi:hypothetical protein